MAATTAKGYTTVARVEQHMGRTLTSEQRAALAALLIDVEDFVDGAEGRTYGTDAITGEQHKLIAQRPHFYLAPEDYDLLGLGPTEAIYTRVNPVASVQQVVGAYESVDQQTTLVEGTEYRLVDESAGLINISGLLTFTRVIVDYTPAAEVPGRARLATTLIAAHFIQAALNPDRAGVQSIGIGQDLRVTFRAQDVPDDAMRLLGRGRRLVIA